MAAKNSNLHNAKRAKQDEFYTQWIDIEREMNAYLEYDPDVFRGKTVLLPCDDPGWSNFTKYFAERFEYLGLKKLISTSYAPKANMEGAFYEPEQAMIQAAQYDPELDYERGKIFVLDGADVNADGRVDMNDFRWEYLAGDGDFRSDEVTRLRDEADMVITNPPFSLFREFMAWLVEGEVEFAVIGSKNAITYKEIFPLIKDNKLWLGRGFVKGDAYFRIPESMVREFADGVYDEERQLVHFRNIDWFTNIEHGRRHEPLRLMSMKENQKYNKRIINNPNSYKQYDNYDAIEVPVTAGIPNDYTVEKTVTQDEYDALVAQGFRMEVLSSNGGGQLNVRICNPVMGVPISFLDKYCPEQFEILNANGHRSNPQVRVKSHGLVKDKEGAIGGKPVYVRILIRHRMEALV